MSEVKVNKISPRTNCGTVQLGDSGDTITIPAGATIVNNGTQTGFGRTGTVNWDTTAKTASFTAVSGNGYFVNTTSGAITVTMPATPSAGDIVGIKDYAGTFATNSVTVGRNGSNFDGEATDPVLTTDQLSVFFVYVDGTQGWKATQSDSGGYGAAYVTATGGCITTCGNYKIHTFTGPGTFCVSNAGNICGSNTVDYLVVAGGGGGGYFYGGGGGAGGARMSSGAASGCYTVGPLGSGVSALPVTATGYPITVGAGGNGSTSGTPVDPLSYNGIPGSTSIFSSITSAGGGGGAGRYNTAVTGLSGGSGGGATGGGVGSASGGAGNTPPVSPPQGQPGGGNSPGNGGSGGGATDAGAGGSATEPGGDGVINNIDPAKGDINSCNSYYSGGGGPACGPSAPRSLGGGGRGSTCGAGDGLVNTGSGGGGNAPDSGTGGSGIVIIRYKFQ
jgi:hypothetical protein